MDTYVEDRIRAKLPFMPPEKRKKAEKFLREQAWLKMHSERSDTAWAAYEAVPRWRFLKRRRLMRTACLMSAEFFITAGNNSAAKMMLSRA